MNSSFNKLCIESDVFKHNGFTPSKYTGRGEDISPDAKLIVIIMYSHNVPFIGVLNY